MNWNSKHIPNLKGKTVLITGGNAGLGYQMSLELANKEAHVIIACRTVSKGEKAIEKIKNSLKKEVSLEVIQIDLSDLDSVKKCANTFLEKHTKLDILINNAGLVNLINREETASGIELQMATNHYGHFALTGHLFKTLVNTPNSRVLTMSSGGYRMARIDFDDMNWTQRPYDRTKSYGASKLANIMFMLKLQEKFNQHKASAISVAAHPGLSATERQQTIGIGGWLSKTLAQPVYMGALPALKAATDASVKPQEYYGPRWLIRGYPKLEALKPHALDKEVSEKMWQLSEEITGVTFN